jgi:hypothetical protein
MTSCVSSCWLWLVGFGLLALACWLWLVGFGLLALACWLCLTFRLDFVFVSAITFNHIYQFLKYIL